MLMDKANGGRDPWRISAALLAVQLLFGIHYLAAKIIVTAMSPGAWACLRVLASCAVLVLLALIWKRRLPSRRRLVQLALLSVFGVILNQVLFLEGIARNCLSHTSLINSQIPSFALLVALIMGQERLSARKALSFLLGILGVLILLEVDRFQFDSRYLVGDLLNLGNAASYGIFVALSRPVMREEDPLTATALIFAFASLGLLPYGGRALAATDLGALSGGVVAAMIYAVLGATVLTYFLNTWAIKRTQASHVAIYIFLQPIVAALLGLIFLGEVLTWRIALAMGLVFIALLLRDGRPSRVARPARRGAENP